MVVTLLRKSLRMKRDKFSGFGIGLRPCHYADILQKCPAIDWFEVLTEDYLVDGGNPLYHLDRICELYPVALHGVSLSIGSTDPINFEYLAKLKQLMQRVQAMWVSDHLCWTGVNGVNLHDLMPLPQNEETVLHVAERVKRVQDYLGCQILLENVSSYVKYKASTMTEWEFLSEVVRRADCLILLDINNIYVNAFNHGFNPMDFINGVPVNRVKQFHLAGHTYCKTHIIDTHDDKVIPTVWELYHKALERFGAVATLIERDANIPSIDEMLSELNQAREIYELLQSSEVGLE